MLIQLGKLPRFGRDKSSMAALEFAIVLPLMLLLLAGVYDFSQAAIVRAEVYDAADVMAASASSLAVQQDGSTALTYDQVQLVESSIWALIPGLRGGRAQGQGSPKSITISSVLFFPQLAQSNGQPQPCGIGTSTPCNYFADVAWSIAYAGGGSGSTFQTNLPNQNNNECNVDYSDQSNQVSASTVLSGTNNVSLFRTLNLTSDKSTFQQDGATIQSNEAGVAPILVVSIQYTYTPLFNLYFLQPYTFWVSGYWPVRSVKAMPSRKFNGVTIEPLANQFTTLVGTGNTPSGSDLNPNDYCVNPGLSPSAISAPET